MVKSCCAVGCTNRFKKGSGIGFFKFPTDEYKRLLWIKAVQRKDWIPSSSAVICGQHFQTRADKVIKRRLKKTAVPSCNLPTSNANVNRNEKNEKYMKIKRLKCEKAVPAHQEKRLLLIPAEGELNWIPVKYSDKLTDASKEVINNNITLDSTEGINEGSLDVKPNIIQLSLTSINTSPFDAGEVENIHKNITVCSENLAVPVSTGKATCNEITSYSKEAVKRNPSEEILDSSYSVFNCSPLDSKETLIQKLKTIITVNEMLQKKVNFYQDKCRFYQNEVTILKGVIDNLRLINSVTSDN